MSSIPTCFPQPPGGQSKHPCPLILTCLCDLCFCFILRPPEAGIIGGCEAPNMGAGNQTQVLSKSSTLNVCQVSTLCFVLVTVDRI